MSTPHPQSSLRSVSASPRIAHLVGAYLRRVVRGWIRQNQKGAARQFGQTHKHTNAQMRKRCIHASEPGGSARGVADKGHDRGARGDEHQLPLPALAHARRHRLRKVHCGAAAGAGGVSSHRLGLPCPGVQADSAIIASQKQVRHGAACAADSATAGGCARQQVVSAPAPAARAAPCCRAVRSTAAPCRELRANSPWGDRAVEGGGVR